MFPKKIEDAIYFSEDALKIIMEIRYSTNLIQSKRALAALNSQGSKIKLLMKKSVT